MESKISISIIESYGLVRALYRHNLSGEFVINGEFEEETACLKAFEASPSDIILMDLKFPYKKSFNFIENIKTKYPETKIIIISTIEDEEIMYITATIGVSGYLLKDINFDLLKETINQVYKGKLYFQMQEDIKVLI